MAVSILCVVVGSWVHARDVVERRNDTDRSCKATCSYCAVPTVNSCMSFRCDGAVLREPFSKLIVRRPSFL